ncbi:PREDICTED: uncharacterized protein LOC109581525 isoform X2 [Amphimedon queenslandica]|uniref:Fibronectin type-III domain-containing protein n=1 Tax=Amphimedon queenslandica TaxID=400682 RepID=A0AAN0J2N2_AMPQE|nr:PREDICTED: uncharacterized protein LOC109581525 isoform X2 [Amphimedon queenslandica]|eukprot:XP_019851265.1 PREDICTED: uncharacterized protein LOC109581525 isoform X2 [Amphimedon queenslandica]
MGENKLVLLLVIVCLSVDGAVITVPPVPVTAPIYTTATFTCKGVGDIFNWHVQSVVLMDSIAQQREITVTTTKNNNTNFSSVLTVNAIPINDGLGIGCEMITLLPFNRVISSSELTIRGISSVRDLFINFSSNNSLIITWSPPAYFSNDIPIDFSVSYKIHVTVGDEENTIKTNTNLVEVHNITQCDTFSVSVTAHVSQYTSINETKENYGNCSIKIQEIFQTFDESIILLKIKCSPLLCNKIILVEASYNDNVYSENIQLFEKSSNDIDSLTMNYSAANLLPFQHYQVVLKLLSLMMITEDQDIKFISTYNVQDLLVSTEANGSVSVQCVFVSGSTADGCHVAFNNTSHGRNEYFTITGSESTIISLSTSGVYNVTGYDIVNGSLYGPAVQYHKLVEVVIIPSSSMAFASSTNKWWTDNETVMSSPSVSVQTTVLSPESSRVQILPIIVCSVVGAVLIFILIIVLITIAAFCMRRKNRNEVTEEIIDNNPAYGQVLQVQNHHSNQRSSVKIDVNPAYETVSAAYGHKHITDTIDYETVL